MGLRSDSPCVEFWTCTSRKPLILSHRVLSLCLIYQNLCQTFFVNLKINIYFSVLILFDDPFSYFTKTVSFANTHWQVCLGMVLLTCVSSDVKGLPQPAGWAHSIPTLITSRVHVLPRAHRTCLLACLMEISDVTCFKFRKDNW